MADGISTTPPETDALVWYREDIVKLNLQRALDEAIETHGNAAKAFAWDARRIFTGLMRG